MRTLIVYGTRYGAAGKAAGKLAELLSGEVDIINLMQDRAPEVAGYDRVIVGGSIYAGSVQEQVKRFCTDNHRQLQQKPLGLFVCCGYEEKAREQLETCLDPQLIAHAKQLGSFGYEYDFSKMNFVFRLMIRKLANVRESRFNLNEDGIRAFAATMEAVA